MLHFFIDTDIGRVYIHVLPVIPEDCPVAPTFLSISRRAFKHLSGICLFHRLNPSILVSRACCLCTNCRKFSNHLSIYSELSQETFDQLNLTWLVCSHLNAFFMLNQNTIAIKILKSNFVSNFLDNFN